MNTSSKKQLSCEKRREPGMEISTVVNSDQFTPGTGTVTISQDRKTMTQRAKFTSPEIHNETMTNIVTEENVRQIGCQ